MLLLSLLIYVHAGSDYSGPQIDRKVNPLKKCIGNRFYLFGDHCTVVLIICGLRLLAQASPMVAIRGGGSELYQVENTGSPTPELAKEDPPKEIKEIEEIEDNTMDQNPKEESQDKDEHKTNTKDGPTVPSTAAACGAKACPKASAKASANKGPQKPCPKTAAAVKSRAKRTSPKKTPTKKTESRAKRTSPKKTPPKTTRSPKTDKKKEKKTELQTGYNQVYSRVYRRLQRQGLDHEEARLTHLQNNNKLYIYIYATRHLYINLNPFNTHLSWAGEAPGPFAGTTGLFLRNVSQTLAGSQGGLRSLRIAEKNGCSGWCVGLGGVE